MIFENDANNIINFLRLFDNEKRIMLPNDDKSLHYSKQEWKSILFYVRNNHKMISLTDEKFKEILKTIKNKTINIDKNIFLQKHKLEEWIL